jgi:hypothetical protein
MVFTLELRDLVEASLVAAAGVRGGQEGLDHFEGNGGGDDAGAEGEDVGVVVFAGEAGGGYVMGQCGSNARDFVGGDGDANAGAADGNTNVALF